MSAIGEKRTFRGLGFDVRFTPESGHRAGAARESAYDPTRTFGGLNKGENLEPLWPESGIQVELNPALVSSLELSPIFFGGGSRPMSQERAPHA